MWCTQRILLQFCYNFKQKNLRNSMITTRVSVIHSGKIYMIRFHRVISVSFLKKCCCMGNLFWYNSSWQGTARGTYQMTQIWEQKPLNHAGNTHPREHGTRWTVAMAEKTMDTFHFLPSVFIENPWVFNDIVHFLKKHSWGCGGLGNGHCCSSHSYSKRDQ